MNATLQKNDHLNEFRKSDNSLLKFNIFLQFKYQNNYASNATNEVHVVVYKCIITNTLVVFIKESFLKCRSRNYLRERK